MPSVTVSSSVMVVTDDKSSNFRKFCESAAEFCAFEAELSLFKPPVSFFGILDNDSTHKKVLHVCKSEFRCNCCKQRGHQLARFVDANGATFCSSARGRTVYSTTAEQRHDVQRQSQVHLRLSRGGGRPGISDNGSHRGDLVQVVGAPSAKDGYVSDHTHDWDDYMRDKRREYWDDYE